jgi:putative DNA primase/helicase
MPLVRFVMNTKNRRSIDAAIAMAKSEPAAEIKSDAFDADADLLNVGNGILDLRTRRLRPHDPAALLTKLAGVEYDPAATCPRWLAFVQAVTCGDAALAEFLQRSFGLALSADQSEQRLWIHHGEGSNGKGTALAVLHRVFGTYGGPAPVEILLSRRHDGDREIGVAKLAGKRLAFAQEADDGVRLSEATVKALTGSDPLTGRFLYQNNFEVMPTWHLHLAVNDKPSIRGTDHGIWRRVTLVPWLHTFGEAEKRPRAVVEAELLAEGSGILNWLLDGYQVWKTDGLRPPAAVTGATSEYRSESDSVRAWIADACTVEAGAACPATDLFVAYREWCRRAGDRGVSQTKFGRTLDALGHHKDLPRSGLYRDRTVRMGLRIVHRHDEADLDADSLTPMDRRF